ncbi:MAG TPA: carbon-nitrogen family hydrolase [Ignavibacteriaceae bacterium]|nr:carbon-nitrogen family hydrolase [Ignavibacteriaceae bacterium]
MKIALLQYNPVWENKKGNQEKILSLTNDLPKDVDILVLPEMTLTGFTMKSAMFAESLNGESTTFFSELAKNHKVNVFAGMIQGIDGGTYNTLLHYNELGEIIAEYRKIHPFSYSGEDVHYRKGNETIITKVKDAKIGLSICYDLRFPELYRRYGKERVDIMINIANWPVTRIMHWRTLLKARAIENQCFMIGVNRVGDDPKLKYNGFSSIFTPMGDEVVAIENEEKVIIAEIDLGEVKSIQGSLPFLNDIRLI